MSDEQARQAELLTLRARDFWASLVLFGVSVLFLWKTGQIPLFGGNRAGVSGADWYNSAAVVPFGIFGLLLCLSLVLMTVSIRSGGASQALSAVGIGWNRVEALRFLTVGLIMTGYVAGLVPRVDFVISSGLVITALIFGYHGGHKGRSLIACAFVLLPAVYAFVRHMPQAQWTALDDDWVTLIAWILFTGVVLFRSKGDRVRRIIPVIAIGAPLVLVCAMAFGFRQNVPARTGLIFKQIEYHYYVTLRPLWRS